MFLIDKKKAFQKNANFQSKARFVYTLNRELIQGLNFLYYNIFECVCQYFLIY